MKICLKMEKAMAPHSSTLAWKIPWTEELGGLPVHGVSKSWTLLRDFTFTFHFHALERKWQPTPVFLPGDPRDGGAWWATVYGVAQSRTWLKRLSSSSSMLEKGPFLDRGKRNGSMHKLQNSKVFETSLNH